LGQIVAETHEGAIVSSMAESEGSGVHLLSQDLWVEGLPERGQAHTLKDV
jgi:hypothetical protein